MDEDAQVRTQSPPSPHTKVRENQMHCGLMNALQRLDSDPQ
jgi:hypothetical protein